MRDENRSRAQLIEQLAHLRQRVAELEAAETGRERAAEEPAERERYYRSLLYNLHEDILVIDRHYRITDSNNSLLITTGLQREQVIGRRCFEVSHGYNTPCDDRGEQCMLHQVFETGEPRNCHHIHEHADGSEVHVDILLSPLKDKEGHVTHVIEAVRNVSDVMEAQVALRESEEKYRGLFENAVVGVGISNIAGRVLALNQAMTRITGYTLPEFSTVNLGDTYVNPEDRKRFLKIMQRHGVVENFETQLRRKDGRPYWASLSSRSITYEGQDAFLTTALDITERVRAEVALWEEKERARQYLDVAGVAFVVLDSDGCITQINKRGLELLGYQETELLGKNWFETCLPERLRENVSAVFEQLMTGEVEPVKYYENPVLTRDGEERIVAWHNSLLWNARGEIVGTLSSGEDITERVLAEAEIARLATVIEQVAVTIVITSLEGDIVYANSDFETSSGYTVAEVLGQNPRILKSGRQDTPFYQELWDTITAGRTWNGIFINKRKDGELYHEEATIFPIKNASGEIINYAAVKRDVTVRVRAEEERERLLAQIRGQARELQQIIDTVPEGVLLLSGKGRVSLTNPAARQHLTLLAGPQAGDILRGGPSTSSGDVSAQVLTHLGDRPLAELLTFPTKGLWHEIETDGRVFEVIARPMEPALSLSNGNGAEPENWVLVIRDVTRERETQQRLQQQERLAAVGQLAAGIAHDFNNIMATIVLYTQMSLKVPDLPAKTGQRLETVARQARRATDLIRQILDFSRRTVLERRPMDLIPFLKEVVRLLERTVPESIKMGLNYGTDEYTVHADPTRIQQAVMNLVVNARDAMPEGGQLEIVLSRTSATDEVWCVDCGPVEAGEWVCIAVRDTGNGIPPDVLPHIFEPFFTTKEVGKGTGLGLAQVYGIVKQHKGHIDVSAEVGKGATFTLYLPALLLAHQPEEAIPETPTYVQGQGETILVVEDDTALRKALVDILELLNYRALEAANGREALEVLEGRAGDPSTGSGQGIALVLSDLVMPEMGGQMLFHAMRQRGLPQPVVMLSGHPMERELEDLQAQGLAGWMLKPPSPEQLAQLLARVLE